MVDFRKYIVPHVQPAILDQLQMAFVPHVLGVKGATVKFLNDH